MLKFPAFFLWTSFILGTLLSPIQAEETPKAPAGALAKPKPMTPGGKWPKGSMERPRPVVVSPPTSSSPESAGQPPSDAIVLFGGGDLDQWESQKTKGSPAPWKVENGWFQIVPGTGAIVTKQKFADMQIHVEWATPAEVKGNSQGRGNSGFFIDGHPEIQVLDSFDNDTYPDGQAAAIYNNHPPLVNASRGPGQWQTYDIIYEAPSFGPDKHMTKPARYTVFHNGILVHHALEVSGTAVECSISLQDHGNPVRYRNLWVRPLKGYDGEPLR